MAPEDPAHLAQRMEKMRAHRGRTSAARYKYMYKADKDAERELVRQQVLKAREKMVRAQIEHACGISYVVLRHEDGTYTRATDEVMLDAALKAGAAQFEIFTQAPNVQAFTDLMNRALDKPAEQVRVTGADDGPVELSFRWLTKDPPKDPQK